MTEATAAKRPKWGVLGIPPPRGETIEVTESVAGGRRGGSRRDGDGSETLLYYRFLQESRAAV